MEKFYYDVNHVVWKNIVRKKLGHVENILAWSICVKSFLSNFFWDFTRRRLPSQQFENNSTDRVNITSSIDFILLLPKVRIQEVLDFMLTFVYFSIALVNYVCQLFSNLGLFRRNVLSVPCSGIKKTNIVFKFFFTNVDARKDFLCLPRTVIEISEAHSLNLFVYKKDILWT